MRALAPAGLPLSRTLTADAVAGLTTAAVVIPKAMAYAAIAGLPVQIGIATAVVPAIVYAFLGTSRPLSVTTTTTIAILTGSALANAAPDGSPERLLAATAVLACLAGAALLLAGVLRLGFLAKFISEPVLVGFKAGIGLIILVDQLPKLLGIHIEKAGWLHNLVQSVVHAPEATNATLVIALGTIVLYVLLEKFLPKLPAPLLSLAAAIGISYALGAKEAGVKTIGAIPGGLPSFAMPEWELCLDLWPAALGIALMSFTETIAAGRAFAVRGEPRPSANVELLATGAGSLLGGFFATMPSGGGTSQTAVNRAAGARTQVAQLVTAAVSAATLLFLAPVIGLMPHPALAAVVIATSLPLIKVSSLRRIWRFRKLEFSWSVAAAAGVVFLGTLNGILASVVLSIVTLIHEACSPPVYVLRRKRGTDVFRPVSDEFADDESYPGLLILRTDGRVHFANVEHIGETILPMVEEVRPRVLLLDCSGVAGFEYTALERLDAAEEQLRKDGVQLWLAALSPEALEAVRRTELGARLGRERMHFTVARAVEAYLALPPAAAPQADPAA